MKIYLSLATCCRRLPRSPLPPRSTLTLLTKFSPRQVQQRTMPTRHVCSRQRMLLNRRHQHLNQSTKPHPSSSQSHCFLADGTEVPRHHDRCRSPGARRGSQNHSAIPEMPARYTRPDRGGWNVWQYGGVEGFEETRCCAFGSRRPMGEAQDLEARREWTYSIGVAFWIFGGGRYTDTPCTYVAMTVHTCFSVLMVMSENILIVVFCDCGACQCKAALVRPSASPAPDA